LHTLNVHYSAAPEFRGAHYWRFPAALFCLFAIALCATARAASPVTELQAWSGGSPPPEFTLPDSTGADVSLAQAGGQIVLVHFFATWCEPCREELPALNRLSARAGGAVKILAISVAEPDPRVRRFLETMPLDFPVLLDRDRAVAKGWNVSTLPTTFVLDAGLRPRFVVEADFNWDGVTPTSLSGNAPAKAALSTPKSTPKGG
jgi:peroxiredoxin